MDSNCRSCFTVDVEDWFHILQTNAAPPLERWSEYPSRVEHRLTQIMDLLANHRIVGTFFWLGWMAEHHPALLRRCHAAGHEIACHGYGHVLAAQVGRAAFVQDVRRGKHLIEDLLGERVDGFRAAGFGVTRDTPWAMDEIARAGYRYDSSIFPAHHGHGGLTGASPDPHVIETAVGPLAEIPQSTVSLFGHRFSVFGGGHLRLAPLSVIKRAVKTVHRAGRPFVLYIHPRDLDPDQPRLPLSRIRRFKSYVNLAGTLAKLRSLCASYQYTPLRDVANHLLQAAPADVRIGSFVPASA